MGSSREFRGVIWRATCGLVQLFEHRAILHNYLRNGASVHRYISYGAVKKGSMGMKKEIQVFDYAKEIMEAVKKGVLLTTKAGDKVNTMTISWGTLGIEWGKELFTVFVRENRFTKKQLEENPEFTINVPVGEFQKKILGYCGTKSGRDTDKIKELGLTLEEGEAVGVPGIKELPLTLECRVIYKQEQDKHAIPQEIQEACYPQHVDSSFCGANKDYHTAYYGEIVKAYILE